MHRRTVLSFVLVGWGVVFNPWLVGWLFASRGYLEPLVFNLVVVLDLALVGCGILLYYYYKALVPYVQNLRQLRLIRWSAFAIYCMLAVLVLIEISLRVYAARHVGTEQLLYGTRFHFAHGRQKRNVARFDEDTIPYYKYKPHQEIRETDHQTGEYFQPSINSKGFRGSEYATAKADGSVRIVTLGASSTFGFHNRDDETYPYFLGQFLNEDGPDSLTFEVINMGIAHNTSSQMVELLKHEILPIEPDIVTFYEGINNTVVYNHVWWARLKSRLLTAVFAEKILDIYAERFGEQDVQSYGPERAARFVKDLDAMANLCAEHDIRFIPITQQAKSLTIPPEEMRGLTYKDEHELLIRAMNTRSLNRTEFSYMLHATLMDSLRHWAQRREVRVIEGISILDQNRDQLTSWVHLTSDGNRMLADALAESLLTIIQ